MSNKIGTLDPYDRQIIDALTADSRRSVTEIAKLLGIDRKACERRIIRLNKEYEIKYTIRLDNPADHPENVIYILVKLTRSNLKTIEDVKSCVRQHSCVRWAGKISGTWDFLLLVRYHDTVDLSRLLDNLGSIRGMADTLSLLVIEEVDLESLRKEAV